jgi:hypothetical protein
MTNQAIGKVLLKSENSKNGYSLGFNRMSALPQRVMKNVILACVLKGENDTESMRVFLNELTEIEFINWLKLA